MKNRKQWYFASEIGNKLGGPLDEVFNMGGGLVLALEAFWHWTFSFSHRALRPSLPLGGELCWKEELPLLLPLHPFSLPPHHLCLRLQHRLCGPQWVHRAVSVVGMRVGSGRRLEDSLGEWLGFLVELCHFEGALGLIRNEHYSPLLRRAPVSSHISRYSLSVLASSLACAGDWGHNC